MSKINGFLSKYKKGKKWEWILALSIVGMSTEFLFVQVIASGRILIFNSLVSQNKYELVKGLSVTITTMLISTCMIVFLDYSIYKLIIQSKRFMKKDYMFNALNDDLEKKTIGARIKEVDEDIDTFHKLYGDFYLLIATMGRTLGAMIAGIRISVLMTTLFLSLSLVSIIIQRRSLRKLRAALKRIRDKVNRLFLSYLTLLENIHIAKLTLSFDKYFNLKSKERKMYKHEMEENSKIEQKISFLGTGLYGLISMLINIIGLFLVYFKLNSIGEVIAFNGLQGTLFDPYRYITQFMHSWVEIDVADERLTIKYTINTRADDSVRFNSSDLKELNVPDMSYSYNDSKQLEFKRFQFRKGVINYVVGPSGVGKTTFLKILSNQLYPKTELPELWTTTNRLDTYSEKCLFISTEPFIFNATPLENTIFGDKEMEGKALDNLKILGMNEAYLDVEDARLLSTGEKMKIAIARVAFYTNSILIFDEPFANLDIASAIAVTKFIKEMAINNIVVLSTNRFDIIDPGESVYRI